MDAVLSAAIDFTQRPPKPEKRVDSDIVKPPEESAALSLPGSGIPGLPQ